MFSKTLRGVAFAAAATILFLPAMSPGQAPSYGGRLMGCFKDTSVFDLNGYLERSRGNTVQRCINICASRGFRYAGLQYGESCLCGNSYGRYGPANNCTMSCTGLPQQACGGYSSNAVYEIYDQNARGRSNPPGQLTMGPLSGRWGAFNNTYLYDVTHNGDNFTWIRLNTTEVGQGRVTGDSVQATWTGGGSATGRIISRNAGGVATRVEWSNGATWTR